MLLPFLITILSTRPIVLMHGIMSDADDLDEAKMWFEKNTKGPVYSIEVGNGRPDSIGKPMTWQLDQMTETIKSIDELRDGFHFVGFSQGGLLGRGYAELYNNPPVKSLITFGTPHAGVYYYSIPNIYNEYNQERFSYSGYWKDPYRYSEYQRNASYLPKVNREGVNDYSASVLDVDRFIMVWSKNDGFIKPEESCKFEFYEIGTENVVPLWDSTQYLDNLIGLRSLWEDGRLHIIESGCVHNEYKTAKCLETVREILQFI